ncbi:GMC oxidoreductase [Truncatella angustata]|uniref:GMC oxidoreductase n=1 Tax=Truncatella angustata TaxID=152316 RepID=A0A9P8UBF7_9PEZI|nr:GMC oxidoreductase [Truncatella angustata]KAH6643454.1 GMC oxidoreductase [Truncatella angustata]
MGSGGEQLEYDFIICGGGTSGCVIAGRLAECQNVNVLVIEAGQHNENLENTQMAGGWSQLFDKETDWNIVCERGYGIDDRQVKLSRGKFLGGCSGCNGTLCIRGSKQDFDDWGLEGWSGEEFFGYMQKSETFHSKPWLKSSSKLHGYDGPLHIEPHDLAPISERVLESMISKGMPLDDDMFTHGENPHGCGHVLRTVHQGVRTTGADFITNNRAKGNITILVETHVDKIMFERSPSGELRATGVKVIKPDGSPAEIAASKEVIISGGTYCSPNILNRSGLGSKEELERLGIEVLIDLPGVGQNLMDHLIVFMFYETEQEGLTNDRLAYHGDGLANSYKMWKDTKTGFLATFPFGAFAFARLDDRLADSELWNSAPRQPGRDPMGLTPQQPNVEFWNTECYGGPRQYDQFPIDNKHAFSMIAELFAPRSRGSVKLKNADPLVGPEVDCGYLTDPLDVEVLAEACRFGNEIIMNGKGTKDVVKGSWPPNLAHHKYTSREEWIPYVRENATTCYHASGTCAMGKADNPAAVVDEKLRVRGVKGLRVADCSIIPTLHGGHTQMPAYGIGEKCADLIKLHWTDMGIVV